MEGIPEIIRLAHVPIFKSDRPSIGHPEESAFLGLVGTGGPKMLVSKAKILNVLLQSVVLLLRRYARQMHPVISAILRRSVPIGLQPINKIIRISKSFYLILCLLIQRYDFSRLYVNFSRDKINQKSRHVTFRRRCNKK